MKEPKKKDQINLRISPDLHENYEELLKEEKVKKSADIKRYIKRRVEVWKKKKR